MAIRSGEFVLGLHARMRELEQRAFRHDIIEAVGHDLPEIIENYPNDPRGHSCLTRGEVGGRILHAVCAAGQSVFVITRYWPDPDEGNDPDGSGLDA